MTEQEQIDYLQQIAESAKEGTQANAMEQLALLAQQQLLWEERVEMLEEKLKTAKKQVENISGNLIPNLLASSGLSEVRLGTGEKITVKKGLSVSYDKVADQNKLFAFLKKRMRQTLSRQHSRYLKYQMARSIKSLISWTAQLLHMRQRWMCTQGHLRSSFVSLQRLIRQMKSDSTCTLKVVSRILKSCPNF